MKSRVDQERVQLLLRQIGQNDRQIGERIGAAQPTVWRLRHRKIHNVDRYIDLLSGMVGVAEAGEGSLDLADLMALAEESPGLKAILVSLTKFMRESAL